MIASTAAAAVAQAIPIPAVAFVPRMFKWRDVNVMQVVENPQFMAFYHCLCPGITKHWWVHLNKDTVDFPPLLCCGMKIAGPPPESYLIESDFPSYYKTP
jgi:hypothetical protein